MEMLQGILERIVYESPDTGYTVGRLSARDHAELITVVGNLASINPGESLLLQGEWVDNAKYGRQFQIEKYETILPANVVGLRKYLGSGLIKGIGPKMAGLIVRKFGMDTMDVIENEPEKLTRVPGIGRKRVQIIKEAWEAQREIKNVMLFLQSHDVSTAHAAKIYKTYGNDAIPIVTEDPYRLADDIYGIGFVTADTIAQKLGIDKDAPQRVQAGIKYVLSQKADDGHVFQRHAELIEACQTMLEQELEAIEQGISALVEKEEIINPGFKDFLDTDEQIGIDETQGDYETNDQPSAVSNRAGGQEEGKDANPNLPDFQSSNLHPPDNRQPTTHNQSAIYLAPFYYAELGVANQFLRLLAFDQGQSIAPLSSNTTPSLTQLESEMGIRFAPQQREAIHTAMATRAMILTGGPGTGKTTTVVGMIRLFGAEGRRITLTAPTGRAAKRLSETTGSEAKTIHRLLEFSPQNNGFKRNRQNPLDTDVVIVDETSMVDLVLMNRLMQAIRPTTTVILIGDTDQLPSVGAGNVLRELIDSHKIPVIQLTEIFRQAQESMIVTNAHRINKGDFPELTGDTDRNFFFMEEEDPEVITELICSLIADRLPQHYDYHPMDDIQLLCPMRRGTLGTENLNKRLQEVLNPEYTTPVSHPLEKSRFGVRTYKRVSEPMGRSQTAGGFRIGDKVMQVRNNYDYDVFNGDIGRVVAIENVEKKVYIQFPDKQVAYDTADLGELVLAYATTIHKAQGSEYPAVVIPLHTQHYLMLQRNLLYTGITRAKERVVIVGTKRALGICIRNNQVMERNSYLAERLQGRGD